MKESLQNLIKEKSIESSHSTISLLLTVILKYGIAPIACIYLGYVMLLKDKVIEKNADRMGDIIEKQTTAMVRQTVVQEGLTKVIEKNTEKIEQLDNKRTQ